MAKVVERASNLVQKVQVQMSEIFDVYILHNAGIPTHFRNIFTTSQYRLKGFYFTYFIYQYIFVIIQNVNLCAESII